jgi:hypothetical protein
VLLGLIFAALVAAVPWISHSQLLPEHSSEVYLGQDAGETAWMENTIMTVDIRDDLAGGGQGYPTGLSVLCNGSPCTGAVPIPSTATVGGTGCREDSLDGWERCTPFVLTDQPSSILDSLSPSVVTPQLSLTDDRGGTATFQTAVDLTTLP